MRCRNGSGWLPTVRYVGSGADAAATTIAVVVVDTGAGVVVERSVILGVV